MLDKIKELWNRWKVQVSVVGGVLVVASAYGTCSYEPPVAEEAAAEEAPAEEAAIETTTEAAGTETTTETTGTEATTPAAEEAVETTETTQE